MATTGSAPEAKALILQSRHTGEILQMQRVRDADGQVILLIEGSLPAGAKGPPPHIHFDAREETFVKKGTMAARVGNETITVPKGGSAVLPAGVMHHWWNAGNDLLEMSGRAVPASDMDRYLQAVFAVLNASSSGKPSLFHMVHVLWRHRDKQAMAAPPLPIQKVVYPVIVALGRMLGKYRGDWPGSPESCQGAPLIDSPTA